METILTKDEAEKIIASDLSAKEMYDSLFNLDFLTEEEKETIYKATELYAQGKLRVEASKKFKVKDSRKFWDETGNLTMA